MPPRSKSTTLFHWLPSWIQTMHIPDSNPASVESINFLRVAHGPFEPFINSGLWLWEYTECIVQHYHFLPGGNKLPLIKVHMKYESQFNGHWNTSTTDHLYHKTLSHFSRYHFEALKQFVAPLVLTHNAEHAGDTVRVHWRVDIEM